MEPTKIKGYYGAPITSENFLKVHPKNGNLYNIVNDELKKNQFMSRLLPCTGTEFILCVKFNFMDQKYDTPIFRLCKNIAPYIDRVLYGCFCYDDLDKIINKKIAYKIVSEVLKYFKEVNVKNNNEISSFIIGMGLHSIFNFYGWKKLDGRLDDDNYREMNWKNLNSCLQMLEKYDPKIDDGINRSYEPYWDSILTLKK